MRGCNLRFRLSECLFVVLGLRISGLGLLLLAVKAGAVHPSRMSRDYGLTRACKCLCQEPLQPHRTFSQVA